MPSASRVPPGQTAGMLSKSSVMSLIHREPGSLRRAHGRPTPIDNGKAKPSPGRDDPAERAAA